MAAARTSLGTTRCCPRGCVRSLSTRPASAAAAGRVPCQRQQTRTWAASSRLPVSLPDASVSQRRRRGGGGPVASASVGGLGGGGGGAVLGAGEVEGTASSSSSVQLQLQCKTEGPFQPHAEQLAPSPPAAAGTSTRRGGRPKGSRVVMCAPEPGHTVGVAALLWSLASQDEETLGQARIRPHGLEAVVPPRNPPRARAPENQRKRYADGGAGGTTEGGVSAAGSWVRDDRAHEIPGVHPALEGGGDEEPSSLASTLSAIPALDEAAAAAVGSDKMREALKAGESPSPPVRPLRQGKPSASPESGARYNPGTLIQNPKQIPKP
jgi:hypothetical protein